MSWKSSKCWSSETLFQKKSIFRSCSSIYFLSLNAIFQIGRNQAQDDPILACYSFERLRHRFGQHEPRGRQILALERSDFEERKRGVYWRWFELDRQRRQSRPVSSQIEETRAAAVFSCGKFPNSQRQNPHVKGICKIISCFEGLLVFHYVAGVSIYSPNPQGRLSSYPSSGRG